MPHSQTKAWLAVIGFQIFGLLQINNSVLFALAGKHYLLYGLSRDKDMMQQEMLGVPVERGVLGPFI